MSISKTFDALLEAKDSYAVVASAAAQVDSVNKIIDLGAGKVEADLIVDVTAMDVTSDDEVYEIHVQISDSALFVSGFYSIAVLPLGADGTAAGDAVPGDTAMTLGRWKLPFTNQIDDGDCKRYMRVYTKVAGTTPSITYSAFVARRD